MSTVAYSKPIPVIAAPDILVCGAGLAGRGAAVAAARQGASVWAVDRMGFAGGFFTNVIGSAFDGFVFEPTGRPVVGGIVFEMLERMAVIPPGTGPDHAYNVNGDFTEVEKHPDRLIPRCDPERFKRAADDILLDAGVHPLFHTQVADVVVDGDRIDSVILSNKAGLIAVRPKTVIDTTGDGDVAAWTGCPYEKAESLQPMALHFRIDHVELTFELRRRCAAVLEKARAAGRIGPYGGPWPATFSGRDIYFNAVRTPGDCTDPEDLTQAEIQGRADAWRMFELWKEELPEFADAYFFTSGPTAGARESRRIVARTTVRQQDVSADYRPGARAADCTDSVGLGWSPIDIHGAPGDVVATGPTRPFQIPLGALIPRDGPANLLAACKNIGTTHMTSGCYRLHPIEWNIGEAAGALAAFCIGEGCGAAAVHEQEQLLRRFQTRLVEAGVPLYWFTDVPFGHAAFAATQRLAVGGIWQGGDEDLLFRPDEVLDDAQRARLSKKAGADVLSAEAMSRADAALALA